MGRPPRCKCGAILTARDLVSPGVVKCSQCGQTLRLAPPSRPAAPAAPVKPGSAMTAPGDRRAPAVKAPATSPNGAARPAAAEPQRAAPARPKMEEDTVACPRCGIDVPLAAKECPRCKFDFEKGVGASLVYVETEPETPLQRVLGWIYNYRYLILAGIILLSVPLIGRGCSAIYDKYFTPRPIVQAPGPETPAPTPAPSTPR